MKTQFFTIAMIIIATNSFGEWRPTGHGGGNNGGGVCAQPRYTPQLNCRPTHFEPREYGHSSISYGRSMDYYRPSYSRGYCGVPLVSFRYSSGYWPSTYYRPAVPVYYPPRYVTPVYTESYYPTAPVYVVPAYPTYYPQVYSAPYCGGIGFSSFSLFSRHSGMSFSIGTGW